MAPKTLLLSLFRFFRGVHLKDLILSNTALPDKLDNNLINFRKMAQMSNIFRDLMSLQNASSPVHGNMDLVNTIRVSIMLLYPLE